MRHPEIHSVSEPWLLLPLAYMTQDFGKVSAPYHHDQARQAIADFVQQLPEKEEDFCAAIAQCAWKIYEKVCPNNGTYFLDKTPRYYLIIPLIAKMFPKAKFIFLFRNPLAVFASIINTFYGGRLGSLYNSDIDLYTGPQLLVNGWKSLCRRSIKVNYEDFVSAPEDSLQSILEYLELGTGKLDLSKVNESGLSGKMGDRWGLRSYDRIVTDGREKWRGSFNTKFRIWLARSYLKKIGSETLSDMGYSIEEINRELDEMKGVGSLGVWDASDFTRSNLYRLLTDGRINLMLKKILIPGCLTWKWRNNSVETK